MSKKYESWGAIPSSEFEKLTQKVFALERAFPTDEEGDSPIQIIVVDKRKEERNDFFSVPKSRVYSYDTHGYIEFLPEVQERLDREAESAMLINLKLATDALTQHMQWKHRKEQDAEDARKPTSERIRTLCRGCDKGIPFDPKSVSEYFAKRYPDQGYPASRHIKDPLGCRSFELRRLIWNREHGVCLAPEPRWCTFCGARMREGNSRKGVEDKDICVNGLCWTRQLVKGKKQTSVLITTPMPSVEEVGKRLGLSKKRMASLKKLVEKTE